MRSSWDPLSLTFSDAELEAHYSQYLTISTFVSVDAAFAFFGLITSALFVILCWNGTWASFYLITGGVNGLCGLLITFALRRSARSWFFRHRTKIIAVLRAVRIITSVCIYVFDPSVLTDKTMLTRIGLFCCLCFYWSVGMPLNIKIHVMHHSIALAVAYLHLQRAHCGEHWTLWQATFKSLSLAQSGGLRPEEQCRRTLLFALFTCGFAVPTYVLWYMELKSRIHYMTEMEIPVVGLIGKHYLAIVLGFASLFVWLIVLFMN